MIESRADLLGVVQELFSPEDAAIVLPLILPALAVVPTDKPSASWVRGNAMLPTGSNWPTVDGRALVHTAHIDLARLPPIIDDQPGAGQLSFFDGYPWMDELDWGGDTAARHCAVLYSNAQDLEEQACPLDPDDFEFIHLDPPTFVEMVGPYYTIPASHLVVDAISLDWRDPVLVQFSEALEDQKVSVDAVGQLFGHPAAIQDVPTPQPANVRADAPRQGDSWDHLATFEDGVGVFDHYFSIRHRYMADLSFANASYECQCG